MRKYIWQSEVLSHAVYLRCDSGAFTCTKKMATDILLNQLAAALPSRSNMIKDMPLAQAVAFVNKELKAQDRKLIFIVDALEEIVDIDYDGLRHDFIRPMLNYGNSTIEVYINPDYEGAVELISNPYSGVYSAGDAGRASQHFGFFSVITVWTILLI